MSSAPPSSKRAAAEAKRIARRDARRARFARPLVGWRARAAAWASMIFVDHGFFRLVYLNDHPVGAKGRRSAQPAPHHIRRFARDGVRTVVSLRGGREFGSYPLEKEACAAENVAFEEVTLRSREAPSRETIETVAALLDRIAYPALFHCKSGADRAGLMSALYLLLREGASAREAKGQLSLKFGHFRQAKTGILDAFLEAFEAAEAAATDRGERLGFLEWVRRDYDRDAVTAAFKARGWSTGWAEFLVDRVLRRE